MNILHDKSGGSGSNVIVARHADKRTYIRRVLSDVVHETYIVVYSCTCSVMYTLQWHLFYMETLRNERY